MKLAFAGGGTGGHLAPAVAILEELRALGDNSPVLFLTAGRSSSGMGDTFLKSRSVGISAAVISPGRWWSVPAAVFKNYRGYRRSLRELILDPPDLVVGLGGYVSVPSVLAARRLKIPVVLHEQNRVLGRANRLLARSAVIVIGSFPFCSPDGGEKMRDGVGFPVRQPARESAPPGTATEWGLGPDKFTILILGGSRGARSVNLLIERLLTLLKGREDSLQFIHCAGGDDAVMMKEAYRIAGVNAAVFSGLENIGWGYSQADLVVGRAGGATLSEIAYWGLPSILIPYPWAMDDHQLENARYFEDVGAALVYEQADLSETRLHDSIFHLLEDQDELKRMSSAARGLYVPGAAGRMIELFQEIISKKIVNREEYPAK